MIETLVACFVASIGTIVITCILGKYNYQLANKSKFKFSQIFPFEMQNSSKMLYSQFVRFSSAFFTISATMFGLSLIEDKTQSIGMLLALMILINALTISVLFLFDFKDYKVQIISIVLNFASLVLIFGLYGLYLLWWIEPLAKPLFGYLSIGIAILLGLCLINPHLFRFMYLAKIVEENGETKYVRPKYNVMCIYLWTSMLLTLVFQAFVLISLVIK